MADKILAWLRASANGMTHSEINAALDGNRSSREIGHALDELATRGLVCRQVEPSGGRPGERWRVTT